MCTDRKRFLALFFAHQERDGVQIVAQATLPRKHRQVYLA